jgi:hypothetical protein
MVRKGIEEPWRGTLCALKDQSYLFTGGYVPWWNEYSGMHIPAPLEIGAALPTDMKERAKEILTLTKMNWNSSDGISRVPITIMFARRVGELTCELSTKPINGAGGIPTSSSEINRPIPPQKIMTHTARNSAVCDAVK